MQNSFDETKIQLICKLIDGKVISDEKPSALLIRGVYKGFPATFEIIMPFGPFGILYSLETNLVLDPNNEYLNLEPVNITIKHRLASGFMGLLAKILLLNPTGQKINDKSIDENYLLSFDNYEGASRFLLFPGMKNYLDSTNKLCKMDELTINIPEGVLLQQASKFEELTIDEVRVCFQQIWIFANIISENFLKNQAS